MFGRGRISCFWASHDITELRKYTKSYILIINMKKRRFALPLADLWRPAVFYIIGLTIVSFLVFFRITTLNPGLSQPEHKSLTKSSTIDAVIENPLFGGQKLARLSVLKLGGDKKLAAVLPSALIGIVVSLFFFLLLREWHTTRVAVLGSALFVGSSWFLHVSRLGTDDASYLLLVPLVVGGVWLHAKKHLLSASLITVSTAVYLLYVPAMAWLVIPVLVWQRKVLGGRIKLLAWWWQALLVIVIGIGLTPLAIGLVKHPDLVLGWLGLPDSVPTVVRLMNNLAQVPLGIFVRQESNPVTGVGRLPLLDVITSVFVILGLYAYIFRTRLDRTRLLLGVGLFSVIFIALNGLVSVSILLPFVYILATAGMTLLLQKWFTVFPKNPLPRGLAVIIILACVFTANIYHLNRYFVAWAKSPETKSAFVIQP